MNIIFTIGACGAVIAAIFAFLQHRKLSEREKPEIKTGFAKGDQIVDKLEIGPDVKHGTQRVHFRIQNNSNFSVKTPICSVKFPAVFKHRHMEDGPDGEKKYVGDYTVNSDLWGLGRGTTNINMNLPNSKWEIYGMPALLLRSGETIEFFVRFAIPNEPMSYDLEIKVDAEGTKGFVRDLKLIVIPN